MTLRELVAPLQAEILAGDSNLDIRNVHCVVASDLMSDVLVAAHDDILLVTSLASDQMIRTADLVGAAAVLVVNGKRLPDSALQMADKLGLPLLRTALPKYEACVVIGNTAKGQS